MKFNKIKINSSIRFGVLTFIIGVVLMLLLVAFAAEEVSMASVKVVNKLFNLGLVIGVFVLYKLFYKGRLHDTDDKISKDPIALALDCGFVAIASALAVSGAF